MSVMFRSLLAVLGLAAVVSGCATVQHRDREFGEPSCAFVVHNRTPHALEIRMGVRRLSTTPIGALNPGELLTHSVPCGQRLVWIRGIPIPQQIGAPVSFGFVQGQEALVEGERVEIALQWP